MNRGRGNPQGQRGGRGRGNWNRRDQRQQRDVRNDVQEEDENPQREPLRQERPAPAQQNRASTSRSFQQEPPPYKRNQKANPDLKAKYVSTEYTTEKNDPSLSEFAVTDGVNGFLEVYQPRDFQLDISGLLTLLASSLKAWKISLEMSQLLGNQ